MGTPGAESPGGAKAPGRFFLPGPTEVRPEILAAQTRPMIAHRGADFVALMGELQPGLQEVFKTSRPVLVSASSATGLMEAAVRNSGTGPVLSLVNGAFSQRFAEIAVACGREVDRMDVGWGEVHDPDAVRRALQKRDYDAVTVVHSETSSGALNAVDAIARVVREREGPLVLVDSVTGVGGAELHTDAWGLDFVLTGSHKALALPPGLSFGVASPRMMEVSARTPGKGLYFDLVTYQDNMASLQTPTTPALTLLYALQDQLRHIGAETMEGRWARHLAMARRTWAWVEETAAARGLDMRVVAAEGHRSPTVTAVALPAGRDPKAVVRAMADRGWVIGGGYGKGRATDFRIGHMGDHTLPELESMLEALETALP
ncbi:MAG TPA: alanine--glyoxylate aminotransferase family protein [Longimicrobiales bacterium]|nr:alanine--glyoxylate aminotransferase family protein [Longimicrobiales bacterium]